MNFLVSLLSPVMVNFAQILLFLMEEDLTNFYHKITTIFLPHIFVYSHLRHILIQLNKVKFFSITIVINSLLPADVPQWYSELRIKPRSVVKMLPSVFSYHLRIFCGVVGLVILLYGSLYMPNKLSVSPECFQCLKYKWSILESSSIKFMFLSLCLYYVVA